MSRIDLPTLKQTVRTVVRRADARGDIDAGEFTLKIAKQEIGKALGVEPEVLNSKEWKQTVKDLVFEAIESVEKSSPVKPVAKLKKPQEAMEVLRGMLSDEERERQRESRAVKKDKTVKKDAKKKEASRKVIASSESEAPSAPRRKKAKIDPDEDESDVESDRYNDSKRDGNGMGKGKRDLVSDPGSEVDGFQSKPKKRETNGKGKKETNGRTAEPKKSKPTATASSAPVVEDERVKELKSIVVACGVRKQWKKEFQDMTTAEEQLAHLRRLLTSLGMRGQPTRGKAKVIKEKREMAAELGDVLEFEATRGLGITRRGQADAAEAGQQSPLSGRGSKRAAAGRTVVASAAYVGSSEDQGSSGSDTRSESEDEEESDGLGDAESEPESEEEDAGKNARQKKRKTVASSEDSDTE